MEEKKYHISEEITDGLKFNPLDFIVTVFGLPLSVLVIVYFMKQPKGLMIFSVKLSLALSLAFLIAAGMNVLFGKIVQKHYVKITQKNLEINSFLKRIVPLEDIEEVQTVYFKSKITMIDIKWKKKKYTIVNYMDMDLIRQALKVLSIKHSKKELTHKDLFLHKQAGFILSLAPIPLFLLIAGQLISIFNINIQAILFGVILFFPIAVPYISAVKIIFRIKKTLLDC